MEKITRYIIIFFPIILLQILVFNNIPAIGTITPYLYLTFILILPVTISPTILLLIAFVTGFIVDLSISSLGVHSCATVMMAASRPYFLKLLAPRIGYEKYNVPILANFGTAWTLKYITPCIAIHHITLYFCFTFTFEDVGFLFFRMILNILLTILVIILTERFVIKK